MSFNTIQYMQENITISVKAYTLLPGWDVYKCDSEQKTGYNGSLVLLGFHMFDRERPLSEADR